MSSTRALSASKSRGSGKQRHDLEACPRAAGPGARSERISACEAGRARSQFACARVRPGEDRSAEKLVPHGVVSSLAGMETSRSESRTAAAVAAAALTASAALVLGVGDAVGFRSESAEALFDMAWILGWTLLTWATILCGLGVIHVLHRLVSRRGTSWSEAVLVLATAAVIVGVILTYPVSGSGSGTG
jgi:hypothetical protein